MKMRPLFIGALAVLFALTLASVARAETVKARVLETDEKHSEVRVDVAGQQRTYHIDDRSLYRTLRPGHLVVITAELVRGRHTIVDAKASTREGRVTDFYPRDGRVEIREESGGTGTYYLDDSVSARGLQKGDTIAFDVEERRSRNVITRWSRVGGGTGGYGGGYGRNQPESFSDAGKIVDVDHRRTQLTIELASNGRRQTFDVSDKRMMEGLQAGARVKIDFERRESDRPVITRIR